MDTEDTRLKPSTILARKYRPQNFSDLIGQEAVVQTLRNAFATGRLAQAWMLTGVRGVGKTTTARILARALNYKTSEIDKPSIALEKFGEHCAAILQGRHLDVIEMDAASHTGIDDVREIIRQVSYKPALARYKVYIIDEVHMLSTQAFNGLLKTLEEPPPHAKFILATTEIHKVPVTILSRCQRFDLRRIPFKKLCAHLQKIVQLEQKEAEPEALALLAEAAEGSVRDALSLLDQALSYCAGSITAKDIEQMLGRADQAHMLTLFETLSKGEIGQALKLFQDLYQKGTDPLALIKNLAEITHKVTAAYFSPESLEDTGLCQEARQKYLSLGKKLGVPMLSQQWQMLLKGIEDVQKASHSLQAAEMVLIRLAYAAQLPPLEAILKTVSAIPSSSSGNTKKPLEQSAPPVSQTGQSVAPLLQEPASALKQEQALGLSRIDSLAALRQCLQEKKDFLLAEKVDHYMRLIHFSPGHIVFEPQKNTPADFISALKEFLHKETGQKWHIETAKGGGTPTYTEQRQQEKARLLEKAHNHPDVQFLLEQFPDSVVSLIEPSTEEEPQLAPYRQRQ